MVENDNFSEGQKLFRLERFQQGKDKATYKLCGKEFAYHGGTMNLKEQLHRIHKDTIPVDDVSPSPSQSPVTPSGLLNPRRSCICDRSQQITKDLADWLVDSMSPLTVVQTTPSSS